MIIPIYRNRRLINSVKNGEKKELDRVINYVKEIGGIDYTKNQIKNFYESALNDLNNFKDNEYKESLKKLIEYVIKRDY
jgi:octaprenyl-diphosphate synthase